MPIGGDGDIDNRVVHLRIIGKACADRGVGGQFDDAIMVVAKLQLARGAHHPVGFDAANGCFLQNHAICGNNSAFKAEDADQPGARIGRAAHDLHRAIACIDCQDLKLVCLRMPLCRQHLGDAETTQLFSWVLNPFNFQPNTVERIGHAMNIGIGIEVILQPGQGELHAPTPPLSVGTSRAANP